MKYIDKLTMNNEAVLFFSTPENAEKHIRYHLLTSPECKAWEAIHPNEEYVDLIAHDCQRLRMAKDVQEVFELPNDSEAKEKECEDHWLYNFYLQAANKEIASALFLGWFAVEPNDGDIHCAGYSFSIPPIVWKNSVTLVTLSPTGAFIIVVRNFDKDTNKKVLRLATFYFAGQGDPLATRKSKDNLNRSLLRDSDSSQQKHSWKWGKNGKLTHRYTERKRQREEKYSVEQRIYYNYFKPSWAWMRKQHWVNEYVEHSTTVRKHAALLKETIKKLSFKEWLPLYQKTIPLYHESTENNLLSKEV